jgi:excisionase family DNA binding protein
MSGFTFEFPEAAIDAIAALVAERVTTQLAAAVQAQLDDYLDVDAASRYLACPRSRVYDLAASGRLRVVRDGRRVLTRRRWCDEALDSQDEASHERGHLRGSCAGRARRRRRP